jgi:hypothetical protein
LIYNSQYISHLFWKSKLLPCYECGTEFSWHNKTSIKFVSRSRQLVYIYIFIQKAMRVSESVKGKLETKVHLWWVLDDCDKSARATVDQHKLFVPSDQQSKDCIVRVMTNIKLVKHYPGQQEQRERRTRRHSKTRCQKYPCGCSHSTFRPKRSSKYNDNLASIKASHAANIWDTAVAYYLSPEYNIDRLDWLPHKPISVKKKNQIAVTQRVHTPTTH